MIAIIIPGLVMAAIYGAYVVSRCLLQPSIAPAYEVPHIALSARIKGHDTLYSAAGAGDFPGGRDHLPGNCHPIRGSRRRHHRSADHSQFPQRRMTWPVLRQTFVSSLKITGMILLIVAGAIALSRALVLYRRDGGSGPSCQHPSRGVGCHRHRHPNRSIDFGLFYGFVLHNDDYVCLYSYL